MQEAPAGSPSPAFPMKEGILHHQFVTDLELIDADAELPIYLLSIYR